MRPCRIGEKGLWKVGDWMVDWLDVVHPVQEMRPAPGAEGRFFPPLKAARATISQSECKG